MDCITETWQYVGEVGTPCTCPAKTPTTIDIGCADGYSGTYTSTTNWVCPDGVGGSTPGYWDTMNTVVVDTCMCNSAYYEYETDPCPAGETGTIQMRYIKPWVCDTATSGHFEPRVFDQTDCTPITPPVCHWESTSTATPISEPMGKRLGDSCICSTDTAPYGCYSGGSGDAQYYSVCACK